MQRYLDQVTRSAKKPLLLFESGTALTSRALRLVLHHLIRRCGYSTKLYHTHSLRIGAATAVSRSGLPPATIKNLGRWQSEAYKVYTCHPLTDYAVIASGTCVCTCMCVCTCVYIHAHVCFVKTV